MLDLRNSKGVVPVEMGIPINSITLDLTEHCNLACSYCFAHPHNNKARKLSIETGRKVIDWLIRPEVSGNDRRITLSFWGGEPLLEWELMKELVLYSETITKGTGKEIAFGGTTNVTLLTPEKFDFLDKHKLFFLLSIDGTRETHDLHRKFKDGRGSWDLIDRNAGLVLERWPFYQARLSYSAERIEYFLDDLKYLYNKGFKHIAYSPVAESDWTDEKLAIFRKVWFDIADWYIGLHKQGKELYLKFIDDPCRVVNSQRYVGNNAPCGAGRNYVGVSIEGAVYPCHRFHKFDDQRPWYEREVCLGHVDYGILNTDFRSRFTQWTQKDMDSQCKDCSSKGINCTGGCWATNWDFFNNLYENPPISCATALTSIETAKHVLDEFKKSEIKKFDQPGGRTIKEIVDRKGQGCICYNAVDDSVNTNRILIDRSNLDGCVCNMAQYSDDIEELYQGCVCYNACNQEGTPYEISYRDNTRASCKLFNEEQPITPTQPQEEILDLNDLSSIDYLIDILEKQVKDRRVRIDRLNKLKEG